MREAGRLARFKGYDPDPRKVSDLREDHPALVDGRTLFPGSVVGTFQSRRFMVSGKNSSKIGGVIEKGAWAGFPVFTLTLEERATCPRSCHMWAGCFGNAMQWARRNDATDPDFIPALKAEVITLVREVCAPNHMKPDYQPPKGLVFRLHVLGDFFSVAYVQAWAELMRHLPEIRVFGYTARGMLPADGDMRIATEIKKLNDLYPDRWVIRWSADAPGPGRTIVVDQDSNLPDVVVCPQETGGTETCSTCALCWNQNAIGKTIAFIRHGVKRPSAGERTRLFAGRPAHELVYEALVGLKDGAGIIRGVSRQGIADLSEVSVPTVAKAIERLVSDRRLQIIKTGGRRVSAIYRVFAAPQAEFPPTPLLPPPARPAAAPIRADRDPVAKLDAVPVRQRKPDEPLMPQRPHAHNRGGWGRQIIGSADQFDIGTAEERIAALPQSEAERIAAQYGAVIKKEPS